MLWTVAKICHWSVIILLCGTSLTHWWKWNPVKWGNSSKANPCWLFFTERIEWYKSNAVMFCFSVWNLFCTQQLKKKKNFVVFGLFDLFSLFFFQLLPRRVLFFCNRHALYRSLSSLEYGLRFEQIPLKQMYVTKLTDWCNISLKLIIACLYS